MSYVSRLALLGLVLSVAVLVVVVSVINGFERELRERVMGVLPHMTVEAAGGLRPAEVASFMAAGPGPGLTAVAPFVSGMALLSANGRIRGVKLTGVDPESYAPVTDIVRFTRAGTLQTLNERRYGILLGARLAADLSVEVGDDVLIVLPVGALTPAGAVPRQRRFNVVDVFDSQSQLDGQTALIALPSAQRLFRTGERVHGVQGRLADLFQVDGPRQWLYQMFDGAGVRVRSWMSEQGSLYQAIAVQKLTMFVLLSFLVAVAAFNLVSGLIMIVEQRKNDVAVFRTLGADSPSVLLLFCTIGTALALSGIAFGLGLGVAFAQGLPHLYALLSQSLEVDLMTQYFIAYLPVDVRASDLLQIGAAALVLSLLATVYPAWRATRLLPSRVLAHE